MIDVLALTRKRVVIHRDRASIAARPMRTLAV